MILANLWAGQRAEKPIFAPLGAETDVGRSAVQTARIRTATRPRNLLLNPV